MKHWSRSALLLALCSGLQAAELAGSNADIAQFLKDNGRFISRLDADVTGEGIPDAIVVLAHDHNATVTVTVLMQLNGKTADGKGTLKGIKGSIR